MLYDLERDPGQFTNLAMNPDFQPVRDRLHKQLRERIAAAARRGR